MNWYFCGGWDRPRASGSGRRCNSSSRKRVNILPLPQQHLCTELFQHLHGKLFQHLCDKWSQYLCSKLRCWMRPRACGFFRRLTSSSRKSVHLCSKCRFICVVDSISVVNVLHKYSSITSGGWDREGAALVGDVLDHRAKVLFKRLWRNKNYHTNALLPLASQMLYFY